MTAASLPAPELEPAASDAWWDWTAEDDMAEDDPDPTLRSERVPVLEMTRAQHLRVLVATTALALSIVVVACTVISSLLIFLAWLYIELRALL